MGPIFRLFNGSNVAFLDALYISFFTILFIIYTKQNGTDKNIVQLFIMFYILVIMKILELFMRFLSNHSKDMSLEFPTSAINMGYKVKKHALIITRRCIQILWLVVWYIRTIITYPKKQMFSHKNVLVASLIKQITLLKLYKIALPFWTREKWVSQPGSRGSGGSWSLKAALYQAGLILAGTKIYLVNNDLAWLTS